MARQRTGELLVVSYRLQKPFALSLSTWTSFPTSKTTQITLYFYSLHNLLFQNQTHSQYALSEEANQTFTTLPWYSTTLHADLSSDKHSISGLAISETLADLSQPHSRHKNSSTKPSCLRLRSSRLRSLSSPRESKHSSSLPCPLSRAVCLSASTSSHAAKFSFRVADFILGPPEIDIDLFIKFGGFATKKTAQNQWGTLKKKLLARPAEGEEGYKGILPLVRHLSAVPRLTIHL